MCSADNNSALIQAFRNSQGGVGSFLTAKQKQSITDGPGNDPEKKEPYDPKGLDGGVEAFFQNHPISLTERKK